MHPAGGRMRKHFGLVLVLAAWLVFFLPLISGQYVYYLDDLKILYYPIEQAYAQFQSEFSLPQWSPLFGFGQPLLAWGQLGFFTPLHVVLRALTLTPLTLLQVSVVTYFLIGAVGMYLFLAARRYHILSAALGSLIFIFCGFSIGHLNHVNFYTATMLLPWLLLTIHWLIQKPTWRRGVVTALVAAAIALSGQPQVVLYTLAIAAIIGIGLTAGSGAYSKKLLLVTAASAVLWLALSSLAILPLREFLPFTERSGDLPAEELFDFSYPPYHAITLVLPYFFGDHDNYWGAKGFQELAAYVGVIPLWLAGAALFVSPRRHRAEQVTGALLLVIGIIIGLGKYSPLYVWLVENHYITSLANPGRFVFFFDMGIVFLAASGLEEIRRWTKQPLVRRLAFIIAGFAALAVSAAPFLIHLGQDARAYKQLVRIFATWEGEAIVATASAALLVVCLLLLQWPRPRLAVPFILTVTAGASLVAYSWQYNPRTARSTLANAMPFALSLQQFAATNALPARLYARPELLRDTAQITLARSDEISPTFTIYQPLHITEPNFSCLRLRLTKDKEPGTAVTIGIHTSLSSDPIRTATVAAEDILSSSDSTVCFTPIETSDQQPLIARFTSGAASGIYAVYQSAAASSDNVYFVRKQKPTPAQLVESQKPARLIYEAVYTTRPDLESALSERHVNVIAGASSARWISALSVRWYREFIEEFFANDNDQPVDGDGVHVIVRNRKLLDLAGVTHLAQALPVGTPDTMDTNNFPLLAASPAGAHEARLYTNPQAYPKAFIVGNAIWDPADDQTRFLMMNPAFNPRTTVYMNGPTPPASLPSSHEPVNGQANIVRYEPTRVDVAVTASRASVLVVTDTWTPQWQTFVDDAPAAPLKADSVFRAAIVPAGAHTVSFRYYSPATQQAKVLTIIGILISVVSLLPAKRIYSHFLTRKE